MTELTAYRTLALRDALAQNPDVAFLAAFYRCTSESRVEIDVKSVVFGNQAPGLNDTAIAKAVDDRHHCWSEQLPREPGELWDALVAFDTDSRQALFAHCMALSVNAVHESWNRRPRVLAHADRVAGAVDLDVAARRVVANGRQLSRPCDQAPHHPGRTRGKGRAGCTTHRS